jgi:Ca2+:H+ antiporter
MGPRADDFREIDIRRVDADAHAHVVDLVATASVPVGRIIADHRGEIIARLAVLVVTMIPIVLLSHDMATLLDDGLGRAGAPVALTGVLIAGVVFLPEGLTSVRAALGGEMQRVSNLCHGALVSTLALTIPSVLAVGLITGETVVLAESSVNLTLLAVTVLVSWSTFTARRITTAHGIVHLGLFVVYGVTVLV